MYFKPYYLGCLAHASYLIGGDNGEAAVIDPRRDVDEYLADAEAAGLRICHVIETHLHADFVSGHIELARRTGATIHVGHRAGATFPHHAVHEGDKIQLGEVLLRFLETPGHTPEDTSILVFIGTDKDPRMVFTGDTLFIGDVGRPDLAGLRTDLGPEDMAHMMYGSLANKLLKLPDDTEVWPAHGAGSACGRSLSDERVSTIGRERRENPALQFIIAGDEQGFLRYDIDGLPPVPPYFRHDALTNRAGASSIDEILAEAKALSVDETIECIENGATVLDTRSISDFGAAHMPGAVHVQLEGMFAPWVGVVVRPDADLIVVAAPGRETEAVTRLARVGYDRILGWIDGEITAWAEAGNTVQCVTQVSPGELQEALKRADPPFVLDVRTQAEWDRGHIPGSIHIPLSQLESRITEVPDRPMIVICGSGFRSSIACSLLQRAGRNDMSNVVGGWAAWQAANKER